MEMSAGAWLRTSCRARVRVRGNASECAGASGHGGLLVIEGDASSRCGISLKGCDIVVGGSVGHMSAFMAQAGTLVVCGDAAHGLGDSLYEAVIYVRGTIEGLGTDAREEPLGASDVEKLTALLARAGFNTTRTASSVSPRPARCTIGTSTVRNTTKRHGMSTDASQRRDPPGRGRFVQSPGARLHPSGGRVRAVRDPRLGSQAPRADF